MRPPDAFARLVTTWLDEEAVAGPPDYLGEVLTRTSVTRQRPAWLSPGRWLPVTMTTSVRPAPMPPVARYLLLAVLLVVLVVAAIVVAGNRPPRLPSPFGPAANGRVIFDADGAIVSIRPDGSDPRVLVDASAHASTPYVSPDGTKIAYYTNDPSMVAGGALWIAGIDGSGARNATGPSLVLDPLVEPSWSPDSTRVVFAATYLGEMTLLVASVDAPARPLAVPSSSPDGPHHWLQPEWSPSGEWIAFADEDPMLAATIAVIRPDGSGFRPIPTKLTAAQGMLGVQLWAPDLTNRLAFGIGLGADCKCSGIGVVDVDTGQESLVSDDPGVAEFGPTWSQDGTHLAFRRGWDIVVRPVGDDPADRSHEKTLVDQLFITPMAWSPDGRKLIGLGRSALDITVIDVSGREPPVTIPVARNEAHVIGWQRVGE